MRNIRLHVHQSLLLSSSSKKKSEWFRYGPKRHVDLNGSFLFPCCFSGAKELRQALCSHQAYMSLHTSVHLTGTVLRNPHCMYVP
jgi:hypothetical protein